MILGGVKRSRRVTSIPN